MLQKLKITQIYRRYFDYVLLFLTLAVVLFGIVMIYSATYSYPNTARYIVTQSAAMVLGVALAFLITLIDYRNIGQAYKIIYVFNIAALCAVFIFGTGKDQWGGQRWIRFGSIGIQPSEIVKIGFIITLAKYLSLIKENLNEIKSLLGLLLFIIFPVVLVARQPDLGTALSFVFIFAVMIYICGLHYKYILGGLLSAAALIPVAWTFFLKPYQKSRLLVFLTPYSDPLNTGYHIIQSKTAVGAGHISGRGLFGGFQTQFGHLPEKHTDFIFAVIAEELGFIGSVSIIILLGLLIYRCISIARAAKDDFGSLMCVGISSMFIFQALQNIAMCVGLAPITGIPLPFVSYGGSSLVTNFIGIGLILNVHLRHRISLFQ
jgi:rod shape determining protein RodA